MHYPIPEFCINDLCRHPPSLTLFYIIWRYHMYTFKKHSYRVHFSKVIHKKKWKVRECIWLIPTLYFGTNDLKYINSKTILLYGLLYTVLQNSEYISLHNKNNLTGLGGGYADQQLAGCLPNIHKGLGSILALPKTGHSVLHLKSHI